MPSQILARFLVFSLLGFLGAWADDRFSGPAARLKRTVWINGRGMQRLWLAALLLAILPSFFVTFYLHADPFVEFLWFGAALPFTALGLFTGALTIRMKQWAKGGVTPPVIDAPPVVVAPEAPTPDATTPGNVTPAATPSAASEAGTRAAPAKPGEHTLATGMEAIGEGMKAIADTLKVIKEKSPGAPPEPSADEKAKRLDDRLGGY